MIYPHHTVQVFCIIVIPALVSTVCCMQHKCADVSIDKIYPWTMYCTASLPIPQDSQHVSTSSTISPYSHPPNPQPLTP